MIDCEKEWYKSNKQIAQLESDLKTANEMIREFREVLDKISSGAECSACSCSCHDVARKALGGEDRDELIKKYITAAATALKEKIRKDAEEAVRDLPLEEREQMIEKLTRIGPIYIADRQAGEE